MPAKQNEIFTHEELHAVWLRLANNEVFTDIWKELYADRGGYKWCRENLILGFHETGYDYDRPVDGTVDIVRPMDVYKHIDTLHKGPETISRRGIPIAVVMSVEDFQTYELYKESYHEKV